MRHSIEEIRDIEGSNEELHNENLSLKSQVEELTRQVEELTQNLRETEDMVNPTANALLAMQIAAEKAYHEGMLAGIDSAIAQIKAGK